MKDLRTLMEGFKKGLVESEFKIGDKIKYKSLKTGKWRKGTITKVLDSKIGRYETDSGKIVYQNDPDCIKEEITEFGEVPETEEERIREIETDVNLKLENGDDDTEIRLYIQNKYGDLSQLEDELVDNMLEESILPENILEQVEKTLNENKDYSNMSPEEIEDIVKQEVEQAGIDINENSTEEIIIDYLANRLTSDDELNNEIELQKLIDHPQSSKLISILKKYPSGIYIGT